MDGHANDGPPYTGEVKGMTNETPHPCSSDNYTIIKGTLFCHPIIKIKILAQILSFYLTTKCTFPIGLPGTSGKMCSCTSGSLRGVPIGHPHRGASVKDLSQKSNRLD